MPRRVAPRSCTTYCEPAKNEVGAGPAVRMLITMHEMCRALKKNLGRTLKSPTKIRLERMDERRLEKTDARMEIAKEEDGGR